MFRLFALRPDGGEIDLTRTRALAPTLDFSVRINGTEWKGGIVAAAEREAVLAAAKNALLAVRDPESGQAVIERVFRPEEAPELGLVGPRVGDLFYHLAPGYYPDVRLSEGVVTPAETPWGQGEHGFSPLHLSPPASTEPMSGDRARTSVSGARLGALRSLLAIQGLSSILAKVSSMVSSVGGCRTLWAANSSAWG